LIELVFEPGGGLTVMAVGTVGDERARELVIQADPPVGDVWTRILALTGGHLPTMGLAAGERPTADVEVLCSAVAALEYELARRMHAAGESGDLPLVGPGAIPRARGWSAGWSKRLARAAALAGEHDELARAWAAGVITSEHVDGFARFSDQLSHAEMAATVHELSALWGQVTPGRIAQFVQSVVRMLHPPPDPEPDECDAHESRSLSFAVTSDSVILSGNLPRLEGELVIAAVDAFAEAVRSAADHVPAGARRADGLVALVNAAHANGTLPSRGGLPVSVSVVLRTTQLGDQVWPTSRGHDLTSAEQRFTACGGPVTPVLVDTGGCPPGDGDPQSGPGPGARITALAQALLGTTVPLAVGRSARTATPAQRRALALRDRGCIIPGCAIPAEACRTHHVLDWAAGGETELSNLTLLCWAHHRQVDLGMWRITPALGAGPPSEPQVTAAPGAPWPANHGAPWRIVRIPRHRWRR
jgi:hypothetical protein